ncbi:hypothetical protein P43SY_000982 [Pythium insidiosum]|uniref:ATP-dependent (S)-NAD(P)H-hydrate dehydratase n=1 Tax=Pythium insidiosum TaxID=114742 RepID=A0AAD5LER0_PYTIN|nr:hypothetical protein P43SY_000982 [Pythium insidiosum]
MDMMELSKALLPLRRMIPPLTHSFRKGQHGRVGIVGGSFEYTGAPYYAGISALKTGADLAHIFCTREAAIPIKSYSPELIVHPLLPSDASVATDAQGDSAGVIDESVNRIAQVFPRIDTLVFGPGLGRDRAVQAATTQLIQRAKDAQLAIVLDGDALYFASLDPSLVQGYDRIILTPNAMEYARLCAAVKLIDSPEPAQAASICPKDLSNALGSPVIVRKGRNDVLSDGQIFVIIMAVNEELISENEKELLAFANGQSTEISPVLTRVLDEMRATGVPYYQWPHLRALLVAKLKLTLDEMHAVDKNAPVSSSPTNQRSSHEERRNNLADQLSAFEGPPFTLQRLTEVIMEPHKTYKSLSKLCNAIEKLLSVTSTLRVVDPRSAPPADDEDEPPAPPTVKVSPVAAPTPQVIQGNADLDVVARAPWSGEAQPS